MRKFVVVSALAVALLCLAQPRATAGCNFSFSFGFEINCNCGNSGCQPCMTAMPYCCPDPWAGAYAAGYEAMPAGGYVAPQSYPVVSGAAYPAPAAGYQPVGYSYAAGAYNPYQTVPSSPAPSYWYGQ